MGGLQRAGALALTAVLGLGLVACGGDDDDSASQDTSEETTTTEAGDGGDSGSDTTVDLSDFSGECAAFTEAFADAGTAITDAFTGGSAEDIQAVADYFDEVASRLPDEISDDFGVYADAYSDFAQALVDADIDLSDPASVDPSKLGELQDLASAFSTPEVQEATTNIQTYMAESCQAG